jgi:hypothetical protein
VTIADLAHRPAEAVPGFEQHADPADPSFGVAVLWVRRNPALDKPTYFPPCTADPDRSTELTAKPGARDPAGRLADRRSVGRGGPHLPVLLHGVGEVDAASVADGSHCTGDEWGCVRTVNPQSTVDTRGGNAHLPGGAHLATRTHAADAEVAARRSFIF